MKISIKQILLSLEEEGVPFSFEGETEGDIVGFSNLQELESHSIIWIKSEAFLSDELQSRIIPEKELLVVAPFPILNAKTIVTDYPKGVFFSIVNRFFAPPRQQYGKGGSCILTSDVGEDVSIGPNCFIGENVSIGARTIIHPGTSIICPCRIGCDCEIYPGVVIGADGFGYFIDSQGVPHREVHHRGVLIGDRVEIGANTCIDRGLLTDTIIEDDVKIDNLCQVAHNAILRKNTMVVAGSIVCGSTDLGDGAYIAPNSTILEQVSIGAKSTVGAGSVVLKNVGDEMGVFGNPARIIRK